MKIFPLIAAATVAAFAVPAAASAAPVSAAPAGIAVELAAAPAALASAQRWRHGRGGHWRRVCTTQWRHHRRVRTCRRVRTWR